jgi:cytochrome c biogenesis factor
MKMFDIFLLGLLGVSVLTGLTTEAIKGIYTELGKKYYSNTIAGIVSVILSIVVGIGYMMLTNTAFDISAVVILLALCFLSWLCAMVGYDKVIQAITQVKTKWKDDNNGDNN